MRVLLLLAVMMAAVGCRQVEETENPISSGLSEMGATTAPDRRSTSVELSRMQFDDVPVLDGFFLRNHRNETFSYSYGSRRVGRFVYWGREGREEEVIQRYLELMPKDPYNWSLSSPRQGAEWRLEFTKPGSRCEISLSRERLAAKEGLLVTIWVEST